MHRRSPKPHSLVLAAVHWSFRARPCRCLRCGWGEPSPSAAVAWASSVPTQTWQGRAQFQRSCGLGEPSSVVPSRPLGNPGRIDCGDGCMVSPHPWAAFVPLRQWCRDGGPLRASFQLLAYDRCALREGAHGQCHRHLVRPVTRSAHRIVVRCNMQSPLVEHKSKLQQAALRPRCATLVRADQVHR